MTFRRKIIQNKNKVNSPTTIGKNSRKVICWIKAPTIFLASWNILSSFQCLFIFPKVVASLLWYLTHTVCKATSPDCSPNLASPPSKHSVETYRVHHLVDLVDSEVHFPKGVHTVIFLKIVNMYILFLQEKFRYYILDTIRGTIIYLSRHNMSDRMNRIFYHFGMFW